jgi:hypothetical protein
LYGKSGNLKDIILFFLWFNNNLFRIILNDLPL